MPFVLQMWTDSSYIHTVWERGGEQTGKPLPKPKPHVPRDKRASNVGTRIVSPTVATNERTNSDDAETREEARKAVAGGGVVVGWTRSFSHSSMASSSAAVRGQQPASQPPPKVGDKKRWTASVETSPALRQNRRRARHGQKLPPYS